VEVRWRLGGSRLGYGFRLLGFTAHFQIECFTN
jgi:hypothetical protein